MSSPWTVTVDQEWIAWLTLDLPGRKVNTLTAAVMTELGGILDQFPGDRQIRALVITSAKRDSFIVGADIDELAAIKNVDDAQAKARAGREVFDTLQAVALPTIAVIDGACLGGGLEMALACDYRLVTDGDKTSLGLPEVNLGILPGWGGTQRLPNLIGLTRALQMILTGKAVDGPKAYRVGLADGIVAPQFLKEQTHRFVDRVLGASGRREVFKRRRSAVPFPMRLLAATWPGRQLIYGRVERQVLARTRGHYPAPLEALQVVSGTHRRRSVDGGAVETEAFARLTGTSISRNLVWLFQAGQRLKKGVSPSSKPPRPISAVGVVGAGIMGSGIAWALSNAGISVRMKDVQWEAVVKGMASVASIYRRRVKRRRMTPDQMNLAMHRIAPTVDDVGFGRLDLVIEAVVEDLQIKKTVLRSIEKHVRPDTIIATNTSSLSLEALAGDLAHPERFVGLHFFNPVNRMPLVEVVAAGRTSPETLVAAAAFVKRLGKIPMVVGDCAGFLVNRILLPYLIESAWMFEEGTEIERIDGLLEKFGMPMGPLALVDEVGLDVGYKVAKVLEDAYGDRMHVPGAFGAIAESGDFLGKKSGCGFYRYRNGHRRPNRRLGRLAKRSREVDGVRARELSDEEIVDRAILIMVNEAARCIGEGVVEGPEAVDMAMVLGTGFAPFRGGLLRYADECGVSGIKARLGELASAFGDRFTAAPLIDSIADNGGGFYGSASGGVIDAK